uniref:Uncharacterized protein n=1 Tax=Glossina austeni TaxID=7395 RepID=A0A1A9V702_GLOAU
MHMNSAAPPLSIYIPDYRDCGHKKNLSSLLGSCPYLLSSLLEVYPASYILLVKAILRKALIDNNCVVDDGNDHDDAAYDDYDDDDDDNDDDDDDNDDDDNEDEEENIV